jgi:regulator of extracellular matrix RemA (YlzA/DUF370 family)
MKQLLHLGSGNAILASRIVCLVSPNSAPIRRLKHDARSQGRLIDATEGKQTRAVIVTDSGHVVLSSMTPSTLTTRLRG